VPDKTYEDRLAGYIEVKDRIARFYELYGQGRLVTGEVRLTNEPDGVPRVMVQGLAYRSPEDLHPGIGWSWMVLPGTTPYTRGSELENTETSAWGRAIASLGILIDKSIASGQEVQNKQGADTTSAPTAETNEAYRETEELLGDYSGAGMVRLGAGDGYKLESRDGPNGHVIGFRMEFKDDKAIPQVIVEGSAGEALYLASGMNAGTLRDTRLRVKGRLFSVKSNRARQSWKRLRVSEWANHDYTFPADPADAPLPEPTEAEAETVPLFDEDEQAMLDEAIGAVP